jgi:hypothetical protein|tara:strand:- start:5469 stop:5684 length:216 start_codon:yes stop_codon:yes gene_type:complete
MLKPKLSVKKHEQSNQVTKIIDAVESGDLARLNLLIPEAVKHEFSLACMKNKVKMTPILVEFMKQYIDSNK